MVNKSDSINSQPNFNPAIASGIAEPKGEGVDLDDLPLGAVLDVETGHHSYRLENMGNGNAMISGHPKYCPQPLAVQIHGSIGETGLLKWHYLGQGMKMVFLPPDHGVIRTSAIKGIRTVQPQPSSN